MIAASSRLLPILACCGLGWLCSGTVHAQVPGSKRVAVADGFDFPVGKPDSYGYHKARGYVSNSHLGEDWNGNGGGDSDLNDPIYSVAHGVVIFSKDIRAGWGNCVIVRHAYRDPTGKLQMVDSQYGHLQTRKAEVGDIVERGQVIGLMGGNRGQYPVHLHFEMRKNLHIGMNRSDFTRDTRNYYDPTDFIRTHRSLNATLTKVEIPTDGFAPYGGKLPESVKNDPLTLKSVGSRSFRIPVYKAGGVTNTAPPKSAIDRIKKETQSKSTTPPVTQPTTTDFWSRLKQRFTKPKTDEEAPKK
jgi:murein DD-endopeptidase MepM/ murein hydrolase activator NlpD